MIRKRSTTEAGFTLVEMLVYLAIFVTVAAASVTLLISLRSLVDQYQLETKLYRSATSVMEQTLLAVRQADELVLTGTELATSTAGRLTVQNTATTTEFVLDNQTIEQVVNGVSSGSLTATDVSIDGFTVYRYETTSGDLVRVRIDMTGVHNGVSKSITVQGGAVIRGAL